MARIKYIEDNEVRDPRVEEAYERMRKKRGKVTHIYKALAYKPSVLSTIGPFVAAVQEPDELDAKLKERVILKVSKINRSAYCYHAHQQISKKMGFTEKEIQEVDNPENANISEAEKVALRYGEVMTISPGNIPDTLFNELKKQFSDSQIVELTSLIALYNMINRFNEALKLDPEEY
ncbi:MAG: carboxymuconolactone decarboxylase family protein [Candidatus Dadabacteria bacterium]|nr:carboxymuconolactone decarboxylase family protein [Candidatus Dadabacteria bacterium]